MPLLTLVDDAGRQILEVTCVKSQRSLTIRVVKNRSPRATLRDVFDWKAKAPERCYLCGLEGARVGAGGDREHFIPRILFERGKIPNGLRHVEPLPSHVECNKSTALDEARTAYAWAVCRPKGFGSQERFDRTIRGLQRSEAAKLKDDFLANMREVPTGGAIVNIPNDSLNWMLAKMTKGIVYATTGVVLGPDLIWWFGTFALDAFVTIGGAPFDVPDVLSAKHSRLNGEPGAACAFAIYGYHFYSAIACPLGGRAYGLLAADDEKGPMAWPRVKPSTTPEQAPPP